MHPTFAIVGHPNKGKSSIVATLAEDEHVAIAPDPGTTRQARGFQMRVDDQVLYELIDTPGFQRPRAVLAWLQANDRGANQRASVLQAFVEAHASDPRFHDECELLRPILAGAGILYVVDGAHPYGPEYEPEMEILRWSGQPRMALINMIGTGDHVEEWRRALNQYFSIVRIFDAQRADFSKRLELLRAFRELAEVNADWSRALERAREALEHDRQQRRHRAASEVADLLVDVLSMRESTPVDEDASESVRERLAATLAERLKTSVREREHAARKRVQDIYGHRALSAQEDEMSVLAEDLFSERSFAVFGLSPTQLALTGAATGALAGGAIDLALGGATLLLGAGLGALLGGASAVFGADRLARVQLLGSPIGGYRLNVGPIKAPNVPWVLLGRAVLHHQLVSERNHSVRGSLILDANAGGHLADAIDPTSRRTMANAFKQVRENGGLTGEERTTLVTEIEKALLQAGTMQRASSTEVS